MTTQSIFKGLLRPVLVSAVFFMLLTGFAYPALTTVTAQLVFPFQARGSLIERDGLVMGSALIGQHFTRPEYFHGRPSMTLGADPQDPSKSVSQPYNAGSSGASNLGPTSQKLVDQVAARAHAIARTTAWPPMPWFRWTQSPLPLQASIRISRWPMRGCNCHGWRACGRSPKPSCCNWSTNTPARAPSACSANHGSMCCNSTLRWTPACHRVSPLLRPVSKRFPS